jgi:5-formyltetrahydrofolate cyclo-ligase
MQSKQELRRQFKALREAMGTPERMLGSDLICRHLGELCVARKYLRVGAFWPFGAEVDLRPLVAAHPHIAFFFPRITEQQPPRLNWGLAPLEPGAWGLLEPISAPHPLPPVQLLLVPGLAFADNGHRLGYGRGFFDGVLAALEPGVATLGVGFRFQHGQTVPIEPHDRPVQGLVDERGIRWL